jgi:diguanylate cyclase (GGDEF)-like protein
VIDLTGRVGLLGAATSWLSGAAAALGAGESLPVLPAALAEVRSLERLGELSAARKDVVRSLVDGGLDYEVCDRLWDVLVWRLSSESESALRDELEILARTDPLTGLLNRRGLAEAVDREVARSRRTGDPVSLVVIDLDRFKTLNDRAGHQAGDQALRAVGQLLCDGLRGADVAGRWGGDEFAAVLSGIGAVVARDVVDRLRSTFTHPSNRGRLPWAVSFSAGVAELEPGDGDDAASLMARADAALYAAKAAGGNRARSS